MVTTVSEAIAQQGPLKGSYANFSRTFFLLLKYILQYISSTFVSSFSRFISKFVFRGSRLVASVNGDARVIIQLPRGNLEQFEPRPLLLQKAALLMESGSYYECLVLLRRQKIDLNLLVDYNPAAFLAGIPSLVTRCIESNADFISLLLSSLVNRSDPKVPFSANKINTVCSAVREQLTEKLKYVSFKTEKDSSSYQHILNATLCSLAKQEPPLLYEALSHISSTSSLSGPMASAALKYLSFLASHEALFNAALGECDFAMCRAIGRQSQMDPKVLYD